VALHHGAGHSGRPERLGGHHRPHLDGHTACTLAHYGHQLYTDHWGEPSFVLNRPGWVAAIGSHRGPNQPGGAASVAAVPPLAAGQPALARSAAAVGPEVVADAGAGIGAGAVAGADAGAEAAAEAEAGVEATGHGASL
jgi:hypothetical protein